MARIPSLLRNVNFSVPVTFVVSAPDSKNAERADFKVPQGSVNAEVVINQAINQLSPNGGEIKLLEGTYTISGPIKLKDNVKLEGSSNSTLITIPNDLNTDINALQNGDLLAANTNITIRELNIDMNRANQSSGIMNGMKFYNIDGLTCRDCKVINANNRGVDVEGGNNISINDCRCTDNGDNGVSIVNSDGCTVNSTACFNNGGGGIYIESLTAPYFVRSSLCINNAQTGIAILFSDNGNLTDNISRNNGDNGLLLLDCDKTVISDSTLINNVSSGMALSNVNFSTVTANLMEGNSLSGMNVTGASSSDITSNQVLDNGQHGFSFTNIDHCNIISNHARHNSVSAVTTYNNFNFVGSTGSITEFCNVQTNKAVSAGTVQYGIFLSVNTANNFVTNNDLIEGGETANFQDNGTNNRKNPGNRTTV